MEPLKSPTTELQQVISVRIGNGERVTITTDSGEFVATGDFTAYSQPAQVTVTLKPNATTSVKVVAQVRVVDAGNDRPAPPVRDSVVPPAPRSFSLVDQAGEGSRKL